MLIPGYCTSCNRHRLVSATGQAVAIAHARRGVTQGVCSACKEEDRWAPMIRRAEGEIKRHGFTIRYVEYCEDHLTPGLLGQIRGVTDHKRREVKIGRRANPKPRDRFNVLEHELKHVLDPEWDCGNRDVLGRGGKRCAS